MGAPRQGTENFIWCLKTEFNRINFCVRKPRFRGKERRTPKMEVTVWRNSEEIF